MPVFISYRHTDRHAAIALDARLKRDGIATYLDVMDAESLTTDDITTVISQRIMACSHLVALVSDNTEKSWWVPFEIGEATIIDRRISSFRVANAKLPEYLQKWPIMHSAQDIDMFIEEYRKESAQSRTIIANESYRSTASNRSTADNFHNTLKSRIHRGY